MLPASIVQCGIGTSSINAGNIQEKERCGKCEHTIRRRSVSRETGEHRKEKRTGKVGFDFSQQQRELTGKQTLQADRVGLQAPGMALMKTAHSPSVLSRISCCLQLLLQGK